MLTFLLSMRSPGSVRRFLPRLARRKASAGSRAKSGATAIEFAMIAPIFFMLIFGLVEAGVIFIGQGVLQYATEDVARQIRTGQVQTAGLNKVTFRNLVCSKLSAMLACDSNLTIDVDAFNNFQAANFHPPLDASGHLAANLDNYNPGTACDVVLVRTYYTWKVQTPVLTPFLVNMADNYQLLSSAAAFRNEPFTSAVAGC